MKIGFINPQNPEHWMLNVRRFLSRLPLRAKEVRVVRGICRQIDWYTEQVGKSVEEKKKGPSDGQTQDKPPRPKGKNGPR
jgi:tRNA/rRNA methyltransferase